MSCLILFHFYCCTFYSEYLILYFIFVFFFAHSCKVRSAWLILFLYYIWKFRKSLKGSIRLTIYRNRKRKQFKRQFLNNSYFYLFFILFFANGRALEQFMCHMLYRMHSDKLLDPSCIFYTKGEFKPLI